MPNDLTQAKLLIKACLETKDPYLDLGRCGITDLSDLPELFECTHLKTLVLSDAWYDYKSDKKFESSNLGKPNSLLVISSNIIKLKNLEKLILSDWYENWKIKDLSFLKFLSGLKYLDISHNYNSDCSFLENLTALHTLYLINNRIIDYRFLKNLTALQSLDLRRNRILACSFLENLTALQSLFLSENYISDCSFLENLTALQTLILRENHISDCSFLEKLPPLRSLDLSRNNISNYSFLDNLVLLQSLKLSENHITDCSFLEKLPALQSLDLSRNYISDCRFLEKLTALQSLNLNNNQISDCSFLEKLTALQSLNLNWNQISDCRFLEKLTVSQSLDLRNNNIKEIPSSIFKSNREVNLEVYGSAGLSLYGNPIKSPPIEIFKRGKEAITEWFKGQRISVNEVKVLLVGHGEVGKTTLVKCLTGEKPDPKESATHQIKITSHSIKHNQTVIKLNFWDFGGQEVMHSTHQFFLSSRSIYILVLDGRMDEDPEYWLKHIESFGGNSPVLIALNKADTNPGYDLNRQFLKTKFPFIAGFYKTICTRRGLEGIEELKTGLKNALDEVEILKAEWPRPWFAIKENLEKTKNDFISHADYKKICEKNKIKDNKTKEILAEFLNDLGVVVHFKDLRLDRLYILQPRWASKAAYKIINSNKVAENHGLLKCDWLPEIMKKEDKNDYLYEN
ncbi:MAG TPA: leucine-rich repeat domain-containing protein, partial [Bacteroidia bacterium]|nr:leucine-rich repeat domain-containing protein [Bacteroidia bacterium]